MGRCLSCSTLFLDNPGFEDGLRGWKSVNGAGLASVAPGHDSANAVRVCPGSFQFGVASSTDLPRPSAATLLDLTAWVRLESTVAGASVTTEIEEEPRELHHHSEATTLTTAWEQVPLTLDLDASPLDRTTTGFRVLAFWSAAPSGGACMLVDDFAFRACGP